MKNSNMARAIITGIVLFALAIDAQAESWQQVLQSRFDIVETFDELKDWSANGLYPSGAGAPDSYDLALLPKKLDGSPSIWGYWNNKAPTAIVGGITGGPFVIDEVIGNGKGAKLKFKNTHVIAGVTYVQMGWVTGSLGRFQVGDTIVGETSGARAVITGWPQIIANHGVDSWRGGGKSLLMNLGDNDNAQAMAGIGAQRLGTFFGDGVTGKSGYKKIHVFMMVKFAPGFFGLSGARTDVNYIRVFKFFDLCAGFTSIKRFGSAADQSSILQSSPQTTTEYGANVSIINLYGGGDSNLGRAFFNENISAAHLVANSNPPIYYESANVNKPMKNNDPLFDATGADVNQVSSINAAGDWLAIEVVSDIGTPNSSDGTTDLFVYDRTGKLRGHYSAMGQLKLVHFDHYYNKVTLGGNRRTGAGSSGLDGRYWLDDIIIDDSMIGPSYFQLLSGGGAGDGSTPDVTAPSASITAPVAGAVVSGVRSVAFNASDNVGVSKVELYVDGVLKTSGLAGPLSWDTTTSANGTHQLMVKVYDAAGNVGTSAAVAVNVSNIIADGAAPAVSITGPASGARVSGTVGVSMNATDNVGVKRVELFVDGAIYGVVAASPYLISWNTSLYAVGTHSLQAKAYDAAGNVGQSAVISVTLGDSTAPVVTAFAMPATSRTLTVPITSFTASDGRGVTGYLVTETYTRPLASAAGWSATPPTIFSFSGPGIRRAYAWAKDAAGNVSGYRSASVMVDRVRPVITAFTPTGGNFSRNSVIRLSASASDDLALSHMRISVDGAYRSTAQGGAITYYWTPTSTGRHVFRFIAYDKAGNSGVKTVYVTIY